MIIPFRKEILQEKILRLRLQFSENAFLCFHRKLFSILWWDQFHRQEREDYLVYERSLKLCLSRKHFETKKEIFSLEQKIIQSKTHNCKWKSHCETYSTTQCFLPSSKVWVCCETFSTLLNELLNKINYAGWQRIQITSLEKEKQLKVISAPYQNKKHTKCKQQKHFGRFNVSWACNMKFLFLFERNKLESKSNIWRDKLHRTRTMSSGEVWMETLL